MNYLNSVFVVLLVILVAIAAFGYLINESADQRQIIAEYEAEILDLKARLVQQDSQCQADKHVLDEHVADVQGDLDQCRIDLQNTPQELADGDPPTAGSQIDSVSPPVQVETRDPIWGPVISENVILLVGLIGGVLVVIVLVLVIIASQRQAAHQPTAVSPAPCLIPMQFTVRMNDQAFQDYQNYLKAHKK
jgi:hypothetical protein